MKNDYEFRGSTVVIFLKRLNGDVFETTIDADDFEKVNSFPYTWYAHWDNKTKGFYVCGHLNKKTVFLHRWIMGASQGEVVDHLNHETLLNTKNNLNIVSVKQNNQNARMRFDNTSGFVGVTWVSKKRRWRAVIRIDGKTKSLGYFVDINDAAKAVSEMRKKIYYAPVKVGVNS